MVLFSKIKNFILLPKKAAIGSKLNSQLKLSFYSLITTNNNLPLKIYYKIVMKILYA